MANPEHVEILKQGVDVWNKWRKENQVIIPELVAANLREANLIGADLNGADLVGADLVGAKLIEADLSGADFREANLIGADLNGADLIGADLVGANLSGANLSGADLVGANLNGAKLFLVNLQRALLSKANFRGATLYVTNFADVDLSKALGLDEVIHLRPSSMGIDTIYKSGGNIPEVFLRGCGVPENFISYIKYHTMNPMESFSCFISYSHQDKFFAKRLHDQLQECGIRCWLDEHQMLTGDYIYEQVDRDIRMWDKVLLCCSKDSLSSRWLDNEVATAFRKEQQLMMDRGRKVLSLIPLNLDSYMFSDEWSNGKRQQIKDRLVADFTGWETDNAKFEEQFERVVKALQTEGAREEAPTSRL